MCRPRRSIASVPLTLKLAIAVTSLTLLSCAMPQTAARTDSVGAGAAGTASTGVAGSDTGGAKPAASRATLEAAVSAYYHGHFDASVSMLEEVAAAHPADPAPLRGLLQLDQEAGRYSAALDALNQAARLDPGNTDLDEKRFELLVLAGHYRLAEALLPLPRVTASSAFFEGVLSMQRGHSKHAVELFRNSLSLHQRNPMAWFFLGRLLLDRGDATQAESCFRKVLDQDADLTVALTPLAQSLLEQKRYGEAYPLLLRARNMLADHTRVDSMIAEIQKEHPELSRARTADQVRREQVSVPPHVVPVSEGESVPMLIRVGLADELKEVSLKAGGDYVIKGTVDGNPVSAKGSELDLLKVRTDTYGISVTAQDGSELLHSGGAVTLTYVDPGSTTMIFDLLTEKGSFFATTQDRAYRGSIEFVQDQSGLTVINSLPLPAYLYSVLPSEMPASWPEEALKAQAVAARSYTLASLGRFASRGYDVRGSVTSASYRGVTGESTRTTEAVEATRGEVLVYDGKPLTAFYSANSGGYTEDSTVVWGDSSGMKAVPDGEVADRSHYLPPDQLADWLDSDPPAYCATAPFFSPSSYRWQKWVPAAEIARRAAREGDVGDVLSVISRGRGISGRVSAVEIVGTRGSVVVRGDRIRGLLGGLRSTLFVSRPMLKADGTPEYFIFTGGGWGHGVGMDQTGAAGMAAAGYDYRTILSHYYPLAKLDTSFDVNSTAGLQTGQH